MLLCDFYSIQLKKPVTLMPVLLLLLLLLLAVVLCAAAGADAVGRLEHRHRRRGGFADITPAGGGGRGRVSEAHRRTRRRAGLV